MCSVGAARGAARMAAWRAHAFAPGGELRLDDARVPVLRAPDELLLRVHHASLNPLDLHMLEGYGRRALGAWRWLEALSAGDGAAGDGAAADGLPLTPGRDFCGEVVRAGPAAAARPGARLWGVVPPHRPGSHAQYVVVKEAWTGPAPARLAGAGGALYCGLSALALLRAGGLGGGAGVGGARVLLLGLGGVGQAALQVLAAGGARVTVGCSADCAELARRLGAAAALDRRAPDYARQLAAAGPYAAALDAAGLGGRAAPAVPCRRFATLTSPALRHTDAQGLPVGVAASALELARQNASACAGARAGPVPTVTWAFFSPSGGGIARLRRLAERGQLEVPVERVYEWWRGAEAYSRAARGSARGKLLLDFTASPPPGAPPPPPGAPTRARCPDLSSEAALGHRRRTMTPLPSRI